MSDAGDRTLSDIEREIDETRAHVDETLEKLRHKIDPGTYIDQAASGIRRSVAALYGHDEDSAEARRELRRLLAENAVPLALIAAGCLWVVVRESRRSQRMERLEELERRLALAEAQARAAHPAAEPELDATARPVPPREAGTPGVVTDPLAGGAQPIR